ncbi:arginine repressor [Limosilactobacillus difficilis]|uniref:arginine repressor n=1 Tax=Limosilactobacillus difficilis TaxID=2991838 RepID=UPI0024BB222F|nr:arginine repressor [Limosilactobacillus difficilis]
MDRKKRRAMILKIIKQQAVSTQDELLKLLAEQGVNATQATVSRDIHSMNIVKENDNGVLRYARLSENNDDRYQELYDAIANDVDDVTTVQFINVIKNPPNSSFATVMAGLFDEVNLPEVVGTIAGNDTLILICRSSEDAQKIAQMIKEHMQE